MERTPQEGARGDAGQEGREAAPAAERVLVMLGANMQPGDEKWEFPLAVKGDAPLEKRVSGG